MANNIIIQTATTCQTQTAVDALLKGGFIAKKAEINYNKRRGLPVIEDIDQYPLVLTGTINCIPATLKIYCVTVGYGGSGPVTLFNILKHAGFVFDENDIFTEKCCDSNGCISLTYNK